MFIILYIQFLLYIYILSPVYAHVTPCIFTYNPCTFKYYLVYIHILPYVILVELDLFLDFFKSNNVDDRIIMDINVKTLAYIKRCQKQKEPRHIMMTNRYLKDNYLLAIPFDKGVGICVMKKETYHSKLDQIISLP